MEFEILEQQQVQEEPFPKHQVKYRTEDGVVHDSVISTVPGRSLHAAIKSSVETYAWLNGPKGPPSSFPFFCRMNDMTGMSEAELKKAYRENLDKAGYDVDQDMVPHKREPA